MVLFQATEDCPHQFGYFKLGDEANCGDFLNCADGRGYKLSCPVGLAFNALTYQVNIAQPIHYRLSGNSIDANRNL